MKSAFIYDAVRTPRGQGRKDGALYEVKPIDLLATVINALNERNGLENAEIDDIILGCVTPIAEQGSDIARTLALYSNWCKKSPGMQINRFGASGLEAINLAAMKIGSGWEDLIIAGGVESMSRVPLGTDRGPLEYDPIVSSVIGYVPRGINADLIATKYNFSRENLDELAILSQERAAWAMANDYFKKSIIPVKDRNGMYILGKDELPRPDTSLEDLAALPPIFETSGQTSYDEIVKLQYPEVERINHMHTSGNLAKLSDGAALTLIGSEEVGKAYGLKPRAIIRMAACATINAAIALEGIIPATEKALKLAKMSFEDIDLWEVNETFAAPVLQFQKHFGISMDKINVNGGAIALGHPMGATGAMLIGTLLDELERRDLKTGAVSMGYGMGVTTIIERV